MINFVQPGDALDLTAPVGGVTAGTPVLIGSLLVVPATTAAAGAHFNGLVRGVFDVVKTAGQVWAEGDPVYWDAATSAFTTVPTGYFPAGCAVVAALLAATTGRILLNGVGAFDLWT